MHANNCNTTWIVQLWQWKLIPSLTSYNFSPKLHESNQLSLTNTAEQQTNMSTTDNQCCKITPSLQCHFSAYFTDGWRELEQSSVRASASGPFLLTTPTKRPKHIAHNSDTLNKWLESCEATGHMTLYTRMEWHFKIQ